MGRTGFTMTLLSTLAALVIIVHTAEEEYERAQRGLRARSLDLETPGHQQTWRAMEAEPVIPPDDSWRSDPPDEVPHRRRNLRKRKRRPQIETDDLLPQERNVFPSNIQPHDELSMTPPDTIRRRKKHNRKNARIGAWSEQSDGERPGKRRGHRRKRPPAVESWPRLSEFGDFRPNEAEDDGGHENDHIENGDTTNDQYIRDEVQEKYEDDTNDKSKYMEHDQEPLSKNSDTPETMAQNDRSLSEFSLESLIKRPSDDMKYSDGNTKDVSNERNKALLKIAQNNAPIQPLTLKAILKRSNGRSLSEMLQQNNLSLSDLLQGRQNALSLLKSSESDTDNTELSNNIGTPEFETKFSNDEVSEKAATTTEYKQTGIKEINASQSTTTDYPTTTENVYVSSIQSKSTPEQQISSEPVENSTRSYTRRRFPFNLRRRFRTRPENNTYKGQLSRDLMALTVRKYQNSKNIPKSKEWIDYMPSNTKSRKIKNNADTKIEMDSQDHVTEVSVPTTFTEETTETPENRDETALPTTLSDEDINVSRSNTEQQTGLTESTSDTEEISTTVFDENTETTVPVTEKVVTITQKPKIISHIRSILNSSDLRRQALSNRLKRKRLRTKNLLNDALNASKNDIQVNSLQETDFTVKTPPSTTNMDSDQDITTLEDFMPTEATVKSHTPRMRATKSPNTRASILPKIQPYLTATEETAKFEIEEILNDTMTRARLARILKERNMTLNELVEHRERGSSHIHLADIFHNASREPNPPEPFLTKSLIEPISKETYPLRALLEANLHDPKGNIDDNGLNINDLNIPVVMDFGNNVNENGENMGIMSLFKSTNISKSDNIEIQKSENNIDFKQPHEEKTLEQKPASRESRLLGSESGVVNWNELFKFLHNKTEQDLLQPRVSPKSETLQKLLLDDDDESEAIIVFDDVEPNKDRNKYSSSEGNLEMKLLQNKEHIQPVYASTSNARSVTVVTASIIGLALVLFLLTYAAFKWKQQSKIIDSKQCTNDDRLPSPIFESRKVNTRSSTRSKSPMLTSNIYSINTLDTHAGAESPEYMWDSLRKPYQ